MASWTKNGQTTSYTYNADGLRTKKVNPDGSWSEYHWIGSTLISENRFRANGERHWTLQFQYDQNGSPVGVSFRDCGESTFTYVYYYAKNLQGDIIGLYKRNPDGTGAQVIATYEYDPWGKVTAVRDANGALVTYPSASNLIAFMNPLRYRGYYQDNDTGFYYLQSRYYDPELKRFINADSYASTGQGFIGYNNFVYCGNSPVTCVDNGGQSFGVFVGGSVMIMGFGFSVSLYFVSTEDNCGIQLSYAASEKVMGEDTQQAGGGVGLYGGVQITEATDMKQLEGPAIATGGSIASVNGDMLTTENGKYLGWQLSGNFGKSVGTPVEGHKIKSNTVSLLKIPTFDLAKHAKELFSEKKGHCRIKASRRRVHSKMTKSFIPFGAR